VAESSKRIHEDSDGEDIRAVKRKSIRRKWSICVAKHRSGLPLTHCAFQIPLLWIGQQPDATVILECILIHYMFKIQRFEKNKFISAQIYNKVRWWPYSWPKKWTSFVCNAKPTSKYGNYTSRHTQL
jgi:hypothetical protein